jgi:hypothetical protein
MRITTFALFGALAALATTACSPHDQPLADNPSLVTANATCQFGPMSDLVRSYFAPADRPLVKSLIAQMQTLFTGGDIRAATNTGFDILARLGAVTDAGTQTGSPQVGSQFANAVLACMSVGPMTLPIDFTQPLGPGAFAVRGGPADPSPPVISRDQFSGIGLQETTWQAVLPQRALFYGIPNPNATFNELLVATPYTWSTIPALPVINRGAVMGFCVQNPGRYRIEEQHSSGPHTILDLRDASFFLPCPNLPAPVINKVLGPVGGSAGGFSDFGSVDPIGLNPSIQSQPTTTQAGQVISPAVRLLVTGDGGTPLPGVSIDLSLVRLSGNGSLSGTLSKVTGVSGIETFADLRISQPGTYALLATLSSNGFTQVQIQTASFTVIP